MGESHQMGKGSAKAEAMIEAGVANAKKRAA
jgi:hypothetical protein